MKLLDNASPDYTVGRDSKCMLHSLEMNRTEVDIVYGLRNESELREMGSDYKIETDKAKKIFMEELHAEYFKNNTIKLIDPNLPRFFEKLRLHNIKIALNTGYPEDFQKKIIDNFDLDLYIDDFISSENLKYGRPYPYMIHRIMETTEVENIANVAKIGDTINDMKEGKNAGCGLVIGVLSGENTTKDLKKAGADIVIDNIMELDDEIQSFNGFFL